MGQLNWDEVLAVDSTSLENEEEKADMMFNVLVQADLDRGSEELKNADNVIQLFRVAQAVMLVKNLQYEAAVDELENATNGIGQTERDLKSENEALQNQLAHYQKFSGPGDKYLKSEMAQLEERNKLYEKELEDFERQLAKERKTNDTLSVQREDLEVKNKELKREFVMDEKALLTELGSTEALPTEQDRLETRIKDYQRQLESQRESSIMRHGADMSVKDQISKKNREISGYIDEIRELQDENDRLQKDIILAQGELKDATTAMNTMTNDYAKLKSVLDDTDALLETMRQERDLLRSQVQDLNEQLQSKTDVDDEVLIAFNSKVEEWKAALVAKDEEVAQLNNIISDLERQLFAARMDTDKNAIAELMLANQEKDQKLKDLKKSLEEASKEMEIVTAKIENSKAKSKEGGTSIRQQAKIETLTQTLHKEQLSTLKEREQLIKLEKDVVEKDKLISEIRARMMQYEMGQFGLPEAVQEIKEFRTKMKIRDKNIEELTQDLNHIQIELDNYMLENEELRERLGMDPKEQLDSRTIKKKKQVKEEQTLALNRVLTKEVERLEEERQQLKKMLRKQAMHRGERAVELGLTTEDLEAVEERASQAEPKISAISVKDVFADNVSSKPRNISVDDSLTDHVKDQMKSKVTKLEKSNTELKDENKQLEIGLREILSMIKDNRLREENQGKMELSIPALEKLIAMIESRNAEGNYDTNIKLKGEIDQLNGRNDELRSELKKSRSEVSDLVVQMERKKKQVNELEKELEAFKDSDQGIVKLNPFQLSEGMTAASKDIIASLNEYLIQILQELSNREEILKETEENLELFKRKFSVAMHQQSLLYSQFLEEKKQREADIKKLSDEIKNQSLLREQDQIRLQEFDRMLETLSREPDKQKARLAEYSRKLTVLRVNEKSLARRYTILSESEEHLRKECAKSREEVTSMENAVTERIGNLTRYKEMAKFRIASLQKSLSESVPELELQLANKRYNELTSKYRDLLQKENVLISRSTGVENLEFELKRCQEMETNLKKQLQAEKEKSYVLEQSMNALISKAGVGQGSLKQDEITSVSRQLATLEMKELNERQKADHAVRRCDQIKATVSDLESRNNELEQKFAELTKLNFESQRIERELREELTNAVPAEINRTDKKRVSELEESEAKLKLERSRLKEVADIATHQAETISFRQKVQEKELTSLRKQLHDIQMESDEKTIVAKLHQQIVAQQLSEATAVRKLEATDSKVKKLEAAIFRIEQQLDEKDQSLYRVRVEARAKARFLQKTVQDLRRQFSGSLPLIKQEKFSQTLRELQNRKIKQDDDLNTAMAKRKEAEDRSAELEIKMVGLQELLVTLRDVKGAEKVVEWHNRIGEIRLQDMRLRRQMESQDQRIQYLESQNKRLEDSISLLEDESFKQSKEYEDRQLVWEQHEVDLERKIARLERNQDELFETAQKFEEATGSYVDPTLPIANQLEMAIVKLKEHIKTIIITRAESKRTKEDILVSQKNLQEAERKIANKDKLVNELRLRLPISERPNLNDGTDDLRSEMTHEQRHADNALQIAQSTVDSLKIMLKKKEGTISKYQEMLKAIRNDMKVLEESHKGEMKLMQDRLHLEMEEKVKKLRAMHLEYINSPQPPVPTEKQLSRLADLEEMVNEQDKKLASSKEQLDEVKNEMEKMKETKEVDLKMQKKKMRLREEEHKAEIGKLKKEIEKNQSTVAELNKETEILRDDLLAAKEANERAPTKTMKTVIERLRNQLALKEKQHKALSQALLQLRADMVSQAADNVESNARKAQDDINIQKIVEKATASLETKVEELEAKQTKLKDELKAKRDEGESMKKELEKLRKDTHRKEAGVKRLAAELKEREDLDAEMESLRAEIKALERFKKEAEKLRKRVEVLEEEQQVSIEETETAEAGANLDFGKEDEASKAQTSKKEVQRWEENKKWQKKLDAVKMKLKEKTEEVERLEKSNNMSKEIIKRMEKERVSLQSKIKGVSKPEDFQFPSATKKEGIVQSLKTRIFELEEENNELQRRLLLDKDKEVHELRIENSQLLETTRALEKEVAGKQTENESEEYGWSLSREHSLQKEVLELRKENMELKFDNDRSRANIPRLQGRVKDLEEYCEILKSEMETMKSKETQRKGAMGTGMGGQSVDDMERVIAAMRRVIERLQGENDALKKQTPKLGVHSEIARENRQLKQEIQKLKSRDVGSTSARGASFTKITNENEKIRKDLKKCLGEVEKFRSTNASLVMEKEKLAKELEKTKKELTSADARLPKLSEADSKQWNSVLMTKLSEEKVARMETELKKKDEMLDNLKIQLKSAVEREAELLRNESDYKQKITLLERFPTDVKVDSDVVQHLQRARLRISTLEADRKELIENVSRMKELVNDGESFDDFRKDEILDKMKKYDNLLATEVELRTEIAASKVEKQKLVSENLKLKKELGAFDPSFFEELEDLKYNYKKAVERNVLYERQLQQFSRQFGVDVQIPEDNDYF